MADTIKIETEFIRLDQFMKLADLAKGGGEAKMLIQGGEVLVNGESESRRGRKLHPGDVVEFDGRAVKVS